MNSLPNDNNNNIEIMVDECTAQSRANCSSKCSGSQMDTSFEIPSSDWEEDEDDDDDTEPEESGQCLDPTRHVLWSAMPKCVIGNRFVFEGQLSNVLTKCNKSGQTPMCYACTHGFIDVVRYFVNSKDDGMDTTDTEGNTPLMLAAQAGHVDVLRYLLWNVKGLDINATNATGMTALMKCALRGRSQCARILIVTGADVERRDYNRQFNAYEWALLCGFKKTAKIIQAVGSAGPLHVERKITSPRKHTKMEVARNVYSNVKSTITSKFKKRPENWVNDVGSLFYLVESTIRPENLMQPLAWGDFSSIGEDDVQSTADERKVNKTHPASPTTHVITSDDEQDKSFRKTLITNRPSRKTSPRHYTKDLPLILCTNSSPVLERKTKHKVSQKDQPDRNLLQLPRRKGKSLK